MASKRPATDLDPNALAETLATLEAAADRKRFRLIDFFRPYPKQLDFVSLGAAKSARLMLAANQVGKSQIGAVEMAYHLTGEYPDWWTGRRFDRPIRAWAAGVTAEATRDIIQTKLCGTPGVLAAWGTGFIPRVALIGKSMARGVSNGYDTIQVRHRTGGISTLTFKSYKEGRETFQGEPMDLIWLDEEPPEEIYTECLTRTNATRGLVFLTFTPLKGTTNIVKTFLADPSDDRGFVTMGAADAAHYTAEDVQRIKERYSNPGERDARLYGIPALGEGRVFDVPLDMLLEEPRSPVPQEWRKIWGIDFGISNSHPFAAVLLGYDVDADTVHVLHAIRIVGGTKLNHIPAMRAIAANIPVAWPHDGAARDKGSGETLASQYRRPGAGMPGLVMLGDRATHTTGGNGVIAGIDEMSARMATGRFKVSTSLHEWHEEFNLYHYEKAQIVKIKDDLLDATRYALMMLRYARALPLGSQSARRSSGTGIARDVNFDVHA